MQTKQPPPVACFVWDRGQVRERATSHLCLSLCLCAQIYGMLHLLWLPGFSVDEESSIIIACLALRFFFLLPELQLFGTHTLIHHKDNTQFNIRSCTHKDIAICRASKLDKLSRDFKQPRGGAAKQGRASNHAQASNVAPGNPRPSADTKDRHNHTARHLHPGNRKKECHHSDI